MGLQLCGDLCESMCSAVGGAYEHNDAVIERLFPRFGDGAVGNNPHFTKRPLLVISQMNNLKSLFVDEVHSHMMCHLSGLYSFFW